jgi:hypothetical protein
MYDRQQQEQLAYDIEHQEAVVNERAEGIEAIQRDMAELNKIMMEVSILVDDQGAAVSTHDHTVREEDRGIRGVGIGERALC